MLYLDDILLSSSIIGLLKQNTNFLCESFGMKNKGEANYVIGIEIHHIGHLGFLGYPKSPTSNIFEKGSQWKTVL